MEFFIGQIILFGGNFAIRNFAECNGQLLAIAQNQALFSILGTTYGGDGRTTFALPDLRGRVAIQRGTGPGLSSHSLGSRSGVETVVLNVTQLPAHTHVATSTVAVNTATGEESAVQNNVIANHAGAFAEDASSGATLGGVSTTVANAGGNQSHTNMQPYLTLNYQICLFGIFPSRN